MRGKELLKMYTKLQKATIYFHFKELQLTQEKPVILRQIPILREQCWSFTVKLWRVSAWVRKDISNETKRRVLHGASYQVLHSRKKDLFKKGLNLPVTLPNY